MGVFDKEREREREFVCVCEKLVGRGRKMNSNLDGGRQIMKCTCVIPMRVREIAQFIHVSLSSDRGRASLEHKSISTSYRGQRYNIDSTL